MIMRFLRGGGRKGKGGPGEIVDRQTYEGLEVLARPIREGSQWRLAGTIRRPGDEEGPQYDFVRADTMAERDECARMSLLKGRKLIDERGERLLEDAGSGR